MAVDYKFNEELLVEEVMDYINSTYDTHYGVNGLQSSEVIVDRGRGLDFFLGNIDKYNGRYGSKGESPDDYRKDLMKIVHYGILSLYEHDRRYDTGGLTRTTTFNGSGELTGTITGTTIFNGSGGLTGITTHRNPARFSLDDLTPEEWDRAHKSALEQSNKKK